jgi:hypothetical protein
MSKSSLLRRLTRLERACPRDSAQAAGDGGAYVAAFRAWLDRKGPRPDYPVCTAEDLQWHRWHHTWAMRYRGDLRPGEYPADATAEDREYIAWMEGHGPMPRRIAEDPETAAFLALPYDEQLRRYRELLRK